MCRNREPTIKDARVTGWLGPQTFQVMTADGQALTVLDRTGRAQPGRTVTLVKAGSQWRIA